MIDDTQNSHYNIDISLYFYFLQLKKKKIDTNYCRINAFGYSTDHLRKTMILIPPLPPNPWQIKPIFVIIMPCHLLANKNHVHFDYIIIVWRYKMVILFCVYNFVKKEPKIYFYSLTCLQETYPGTSISWSSIWNCH